MYEKGNGKIFNLKFKTNKEFLNWCRNTFYYWKEDCLYTKNNIIDIKLINENKINSYKKIKYLTKG